MALAEKIARFTIRYRKIIFPIIILLTLYLLVHEIILKGIPMHHEAADIQPENHPFIQVNRHMEETFGAYSLVTIGMEVKEGDIFTRDNIMHIFRIQKKLLDLRGVMEHKIISIASKKVKLYRIERLPNGEEIGIVDSGRKIVEDELINNDRWEEYLPVFKRLLIGDDRIYGRYISRDLKSTIIYVSFRWERDYQYVFDNINRILEEEQDPNVEYYLAGQTIMLGWLHQYMGLIIYLFFAAVGVMVTLLYIDFRSVRGVLLPLIAGHMSVAWGTGFLVMLGFKMDIMSMVVPFLVLSLSHGHSVQMMERFYEAFENTGDKMKSSEEAIAGLITPATASVVTDSIGFASLALLPFTVVKSMAIVASVGILSILLTTFFFIPLCLTFLPAPKHALRLEEARGLNGVFMRMTKAMERFLAGMARSSFGRRMRLVSLAVTIIVVIYGVGGLSLVEVGDLKPGSPVFWQDSEYNRAEKFLNDNFPGTNLAMIHVGKGLDEKVRQVDDIMSSELALKVDALVNHLEERGDVGSTVSYVDIIKKSYMNWNGNDPRFYIIPNEKRGVYQFILNFYEAGGAEDAMSYFDDLFAQASVEVYVKDHMSSTVRGIRQDIDNFLGRIDKEGWIRQGGGMVGIFAAIIEEVARSQMSNLLQVFGVVFIFCWITYGTYKAGLIITVPIALANLITYATMGYIGIGLFIYTLPVAAVGIGVGVDYSIYLTSRLREEMGKRKAGESPEDVYAKALATTGRAIFFTAMTVTGGVLTLLASDMRFQALLGGTLGIVMMANMLVALLLIPVLTAWIKPKYIFRESK